MRKTPKRFNNKLHQQREMRMSVISTRDATLQQQLQSRITLAPTVFDKVQKRDPRPQ